MFQLASKYATTLQLHTLDLSATQDCSGATDDERKSFWDLICKDLFHRLMFDRPPIIGENLSNWRVNLPWLDKTRVSNCSPDLPDSLTIIFLVRSHLTFALVEHSQVMETGDARSIVNTTHKLCRSLLKVCDEWPIVSANAICALEPQADPCSRYHAESIVERHGP
jgi:hypothetical protein